MMLAADCTGTSWPDAMAIAVMFLALAACFIVYRLTGGD